MKWNFLYQITAASRTPGYRPQIPVLSVLNWIVDPTPRTKFLGTTLVGPILLGQVWPLKEGLIGSSEMPVTSYQPSHPKTFRKSECLKHWAAEVRNIALQKLIQWSRAQYLKVIIKLS